MVIKNKYLFKFQFGVIRAWKASANIKQGHLISQLCLVDNAIFRVSICYCINKCILNFYSIRTLTPMSKTQRASDIAWLYVSGSVQPLPTWKLTPITSSPSSFALSSNSRLLFNVAPNFTLNRHTALESSVAIRRTSLQRQKVCLIVRKILLQFTIKFLFYYNFLKYVIINFSLLSRG